MLFCRIDSWLKARRAVKLMRKHSLAHLHRQDCQHCNIYVGSHGGWNDVRKAWLLRKYTRVTCPKCFEYSTFMYTVHGYQPATKENIEFYKD